MANEFLCPERALIFRITHRDNVPWILDHGLQCRHAPDQDPNFVNIGNVDLISKRNGHDVDHVMGGTLGDYVPFYFTPFSPMLLNIKTGRSGVRQRPMDEIVIFVTSLHELSARNLPFIFSDRHAYLAAASFSSELDDLDWIDWDMLRRRDFARNPDDPGKFDRYQAEALVHGQLPCAALLGLICYNSEVGTRISQHVEDRDLDLQVIERQKWFL